MAKKFGAWSVFLVLLCLLSFFWHKGQPPKSKGPTPSKVSPALSQSVLGSIKAFRPRVSIRRHDELLWTDALLNLPLFQYDAVQTYSDAQVTIALENNSELKLEPNSFVIIDVNSSQHLDRAIVRNGSLLGETKTELWVLTSAALLKMKATSQKPIARALVQVDKKKRVAVRLTEGDGVLYEKVSLPNLSSNPKNVTSTVQEGAAPQTAKEEIKEEVQEIPLKVDEPIIVQEKADTAGIAQTETIEQTEKHWLNLSLPKAPIAPLPSPTPSSSIATRKSLPAEKKTVKKTTRHEVKVARNIKAKASPPRRAVASIPPVLQILEPQDFTKTVEPWIKVVGTTNISGCTIEINGKKTSLDKTLHFSTTINLKLGINTILVQQTPTNGKANFRQLTVVREKR